MFFQFSPVRTKNTTKVVEKEKDSEKVEVLSLAPFTHNPKLFFENVKVGEAETRKLVINNPTYQDVDILVVHNIPDELNVTLNWTEATIVKNTNVILEVTWCPAKEESARYVITIEDGKRIHRDVPIAFKSILPKKSKTGTKPKKKHQAVIQKQKSPVKRASPLRKTSPTKKYYSTRPPNISPKKFSPSQRRHSPNFKKYSSPTKNPLIIIGSPSPKFQQHTSQLYKESPKVYSKYRSRITETRKSNTYEIKENIPLTLPNTSSDSNIFVSPASATFRLESINPVGRRGTYTVNGKEISPSSSFSDSLECISPDVSPLFPNKRKESRFPKTYDTKLPLGVCNRENISQNVYEYLQQKPPETPGHYGFEYKLTQLETFCFTPTSTPSKQTEMFSPTISPSVEKNSSSTQRNETFDIPQKSPNVSTETYVKSNISTGTYVKGNASFETYVKGNISSGTYTKDSSVGDVANLSLSPVPSPGMYDSQPSTMRCYDFSGENVKNTIEANLWGGIKSRPLSSIQEESYIQHSITEVNAVPQISFLKRKSTFEIAPTPPKRPNVTSAPKDWSKKGGAAFRLSKKTTGLSLKQLINNNTSVGDKEAVAVLTKKDTNTVIIQNPFLLAATNLVDPFMTPHLHIGEEWMDQQQVYFKKWLNALLTPPEQLEFEEQAVDVAKVWQECKKREVEAAPTKEVVSSKYHTNSKLNSLRKSARNLYRSKEMSAVLSKVIQAVEAGKLLIREDKDIHLNLMLRSEIMSMLLSYNPLWLRIGLETVYNEIIPLKSNSDIMGLSTFIGTRLLKDPYLLKKHKIVHSPKYIAEFKKFFLKKFLALVYFLDQAKNKRLILHDPCLFCKRAVVKESKEMLTRLAREILAAVGDITKYLRHLDYVVTHTQTYIHEFDYAVNNLGVDLRDGVRLTKIMGIILLQNDLTSNLRVPAISRLQKIHNMKIVFESLQKAEYEILYDITPKDIVDGHKEKTLSFLWQIIYKFQAPLMVKSATTIQTWFRSLPIVLKRKTLERKRLEREFAATRIQSWYRRCTFSKKLLEFSLLLKTYLESVRQQKAATKIQSYYRMHRCRSIYTLQYMTIIDIQRLCKGWLIRNVYRQRIEKAIIIQRNVRMYLARKRYLKIKKAVNIIQTKYRARLLTKRDHTAYEELKKAAGFVQRRFRANLIASQKKSAYQTLRKATICLQGRFRANRQRQRYLKMKSAAVRIQTWYRSVVSMKTCRQEYITLKKSVLIIEERYFAVKTMQVQRNSYQILKQSCVTIQRHYRAYREMKVIRTEYLKLKQSTLVIQRRYRARTLMQTHRQYYEALRLATIFIQRKFRANKAMKLVRNSYITMKTATMTIQAWFRAAVQMRKCRTYYVSLKYAVRFVEDKYKANKLMKLQRNCYAQLKSATITVQRQYRALLAMRQRRSQYLQLKSAAIFIQGRFRANKLATVQRKRYLELKYAAVSIQRRYRSQKSMQQARRDFLELRRSTTTVQRRFRANLLMKDVRRGYRDLLRGTLTVQRRFRANRAMFKQRKMYMELRQATVVIQHRWRAKKLGEVQLKNFRGLRDAVLVIQRRWRANKLARRGRTAYESLKKVTRFVQSKWRAKKAAESERRSYLELRCAVVLVQQKWRAKKLGEQCSMEFEMLRKTTVYIQRRWRANKMTFLYRTRYETLRKAVITVQSKWRANKLSYKQRSDYLELKNAVVLTQRRWRAIQLGKGQKECYVALKQSTVYCQRRWRNNKLATLERTNYQSLKTAAVIIQTRWKAKKLAEKERTNYLRLLQAAVVIQRRWSAKNLGLEQLKQYKALKAAAIYVQTHWRANKLAAAERRKYEALKTAAVTVQSRWRTKKLAERNQQSYVQLRNAAVVIQRWWRARRLGKEQRESYIALRKAAKFIQMKLRANTLAKTEKHKYQTLKRSSVIIQSAWRAKRERQKYMLLRNATILMQRRWKAMKLYKQQRRRYELIKRSVVFAQRRWRANLIARQEKQKYEAVRRAATIIQARWRATRLSAIERNHYLEIKWATLVLQRRWRAKTLCERHRQRYEALKRATVLIQRRWRANKLKERDRSNYNALRSAVVCIQRRWRARKLMIVTAQRYTSLRSATVTIQRRFRANLSMKQQRDVYVRIRTSTVLIQRYYKGYLKMKRERKEFEMKLKAVLTLQTYVRGYILRQKYADYFTPEAKEKRKIERMERKAATKIQACWRAHRSRSSTDTSQLMKIRERAKIANAKAETQNTLEARCRVALQALINEKSNIFILNKSLEDLYYVIRHSKEICVHVSQFLPVQLYLMIKTTNRSLPEMTACIFSVNILISVYKYPSTREYSFVSDYIDNIITVMLHWCDKDTQLFPSMCTLLWLFAHNPRWKRFMKSIPNIQQMFSKIRVQVQRKQSMVKRTGVKGHSVFACYKNLPLPSCDPDWGLEYERSPYVFTNSIHAFSSLLDILDM